MRTVLGHGLELVGPHFEYRNRFHTLLSGMMAALTHGWSHSQLSTPWPNILTHALKANNFKHVLEVGGGTYPALKELAGPIHAAGCQLYSLGGLPSPHSIEIEGFAGNMKTSTAFDLVVANNVFSVGGQMRSNFRDISESATNGVLDLIRHLSNNPAAFIVLTETYDVLLLDRKRIEKAASVDLWQKRITEMSGFIRNNAQDEPDPRMRQIFAQAPNLVILRKKRK
jgi:hypothetical protein